MPQQLLADATWMDLSDTAYTSIPKTGGIYVCRNKLSGKLYVGMSLNLRHRWRKHCWDIRNHVNSSFVLHSAVRKNGIENFELAVVLADSNIDTLNDLEIMLISELRTQVPNGYNLTGGGGGTAGFEVSAETRAKLSRTSFGRKHSEETRLKISKLNTGRVVSQEVKDLLSKKMLGRYVSPETKELHRIASTGFRHSDETKEGLSLRRVGIKLAAEVCAKMSASRTGAANGRAKTVVVFYEDALVGIYFGSIALAAEAVGVSIAAMARWLAGADPSIRKIKVSVAFAD